MATLLVFVGILAIHVAEAVPAGVYVGEDGTVGASFGGYSASAGLGGAAGTAGAGGKIHAEAAAPGGYHAAAGLGGAAGTRGANGGANGDSYATAGHEDLSGLKIQGPPVQGPAGGGGVDKEPQGGGFFDGIFNIPISALGAVNQYLNNRKRVESSPETNAAVSSASASTSSHSAPGDDQIPISVLNSVNRFLNGN